MIRIQQLLDQLDDLTTAEIARRGKILFSLRRCLAKDGLMWRRPQEERDDGREPTNETGLSIFRPKIGACLLCFHTPGHHP